MKKLQLLLFAAFFAAASLSAGEFSECQTDEDEGVPELRKLTDSISFKIPMLQLELAQQFEVLFNNTNLSSPQTGESKNGACRIETAPLLNSTEQYYRQLESLYCEVKRISKNYDDANINYRNRINNFETLRKLHFSNFQTPFAEKYDKLEENVRKAEMNFSFCREMFEKSKSAVREFDKKLTYFNNSRQTVAAEAENCYILIENNNQSLDEDFYDRNNVIDKSAITYASAKSCHDLIGQHQSRRIAFEKMNQSLFEQLKTVDQSEMSMEKARFDLLEAKYAAKMYRMKIELINKENESRKQFQETMMNVLELVNEVKDMIIEYQSKSCLDIKRNLLQLVSPLQVAGLMVQQLNSQPMQFEGLKQDTMEPIMGLQEKTRYFGGRLPSFRIYC